MTPWQTRSSSLGDDIQSIRKAALGYLAKREYSCAELKKKLISRGAESLLAAEVIEELKSRGLADDLRYANAFVRDRRDFHPRGAVMIYRELLAKGVEHSVAETAIANEYGEEEQRKALSALMRKDSAAFGAEGDKAAKDRLIRRMISKGFPQGMIIDILADIEKNDADI